MPDYLMLIAGPPDSREGLSEEEIAATSDRVMAWYEKCVEEGSVVPDAGYQLQPASTAKTVDLQGETPVVTDGPYAETREQLAGYAILRAPDIDAAVEIAKTWPGLSKRLEVRPVMNQ